MHERRDLTIVVTYAMALSVLSLAVPVGVQALVNSIAFTGLYQPVVILATLLLAILIFVTVLQLFEVVVVEKLQRRVFVRFSAEAEHRLKSGPKPDAVTRAKFLEIANVQKSIVYLTLRGLSVALPAGFGLLLLAFYHPYLLVFDIFLVGGLAFWVMRYLRPGIETSIQESNAKYDVFAALEANEEQFPVRGYLRSRESHFSVLFRQTTGLLVMGALANSTLLAAGGILVTQGKISLGQLVAAEIVVSGIALSIAKLPNLLEVFYDAMASLQKLSTLVHPGTWDGEVLCEPETRVLGFASLRSGRPAKVFQRLLIAGGLGGVLLLMAPWQQTSFGGGRVLAFSPEERPQTIEAPISGRVVFWNVREGQRVKEGDLIVELADNDPDIVRRLETERQTIVQRLSAIDVARQRQRSNVKRQSALEAEGISSRRKRELAELDLAKILQDEAKASAELARIEVKLARQNAQVVRSPVSGFVSRAFVGQGRRIREGGRAAADGGARYELTHR